MTRRRTRRGTTILLATTLALGLPTLLAVAHISPSSCTTSGIGLGVSAELQGGDVAAENVYDGEVIDYDVIVLNTAPGACDVTGATVSLTLPSGSTVTVASSVSVLGGGSQSFENVGTYTVDHTHETGTPSEVNATANVSATSHPRVSDKSVSASASIGVRVIHPSTTLTKTASAGTIYVGDPVTYTYVEDNDGDVPLTNVSVTDDGCAPLSAPTGDTNADSVLDPTETWTYTCTTTLAATSTGTATATGTDPRGKLITYCADLSAVPVGTRCDQEEQASTTVTAIDSSTTLTATSSVTQLPPGGGSVTFTYTETNDGDEPLKLVAVDDDKCLTETYGGGDANFNGMLDPGETWTYLCTKVITATETHTVTGHGLDRLDNDVTFCANPSAGPPKTRCDGEEQASVTVTVTGEGCTPGFWRQPQHITFWPTAYMPSTDFEDTFDRDVYPGTPTLGQVVTYNGGGLDALSRHAVAALLNAASPDVDYPFTVAEVIDKYQAAVDTGGAAITAQKNEFQTANELGCPLT